MPRRLVLFLSSLILLCSGARAQEPFYLEPLVQGPSDPTGIFSAYDGSERLFVITKFGTIHIYDPYSDSLLETSFLDISARVNSSNLELGLHGLAFHPNYAVNGVFYVMYTNLQGNSTLGRFNVSPDPNVADPNSESIVLVIDQPEQNHNVSQILFGPDGYLYIGAGDGGFVGDPDNRAQDLSDLLGKILRIDVDGGLPYAIPPDNPFVGVPGAREEIWVYGVRNPWRFTFDRQTGDMFVGDVGQFDWEEVTFLPAGSSGGQNLGWRLMEGNHCYNPGQNCDPGGLEYPIFEYQHTGGRCAIVGGYRYRGVRFPSLNGIYFSADWCTGEIWQLQEDSPGEWSSNVGLDANFFISAFGEDARGELYVADSNSGMMYRIMGQDPFCEVQTDQATYTDGETWTLSSVRISNQTATPAPARIILAILPPGSPPIIFSHIGADGTLQLPPGFDTDLAPITLLTVNPGTPRAPFNIACVMTAPPTEDLISIDFVPFSVVD